MPKYQFNVRDGRSVSEPESETLTDHSVAKVMAVTLAGEILQSEAKRIVEGRSWSLDVIDDGGSTLYRIDMRLSCLDEMGSDMEQARQALVA